MLLVETQMNLLNQIRKPKLSDFELIAVDLTSEFMSIDSERDLFYSNQIQLEVPMRRNQENVLKLFFLNYVTNL